MSFSVFSNLVHDQFQKLATAHSLLLEVDAPVWDAYLAAYPEGTNPIFKTRTVHDCSCCRNFVKNLGAIITHDRQTVWDTAAELAPYPFNLVAAALRDLVLSRPIARPYGSSDKHYTFGAAPTYDPANDTTWDHFHAVVPPKHRRDPHDLVTTYQVLKRGLEEINILDNLKQVIDIADNIYRGAEHLPALRAFLNLVTGYQATDDKQAYLWAHVTSPVARFRNTVIGSLIVDLCDGVDIERAVASFEAKVAPANYKRPKSLITPRMIDQALETLDELGLTNSITRRMAAPSDLSVNDVLFVDNEAAPLFKDGLRSALLTQVKPTPPNTERAIPITIDELLKLKPNQLDLLVENRHSGNFVTLTAPTDPAHPSPFRWNNGFAWSYDGNVTDSIKERVKKAGGNVTNAELRISLSWFNYDDLDLHVEHPGGPRIYYAHRQGKLDVDMNAGAGTTREAVENVSFKPGETLNGTYKVIVNNFRQRESIDVGFDLEVEYKGQIYSYSYKKPVGSNHLALTIVINQDGISLTGTPGLETNNRSRQKWGVNTEVFSPVQTLVLSPNHWGDSAVGNKHWFFIMKDCKNPDSVRGIFNEFLSPKFEAHRKVFEILGDKTRAEPTQDQLSGLGFSSTLGEEVFVQVNRAQTYKVTMK